MHAKISTTTFIIARTFFCNLLLILPNIRYAVEKKKTQVILSALWPLTCNSTWPQHTSQMFADYCGPRQTKPWEIIKQGLLQSQGELYPFQTIFNCHSRDQLLEFCTSFYEVISREFLVKGNFKHTLFSREHWYLQDSNSQPLAPKARAVLIELIWLQVVSYPFLKHRDKV